MNLVRDYLSSRVIADNKLLDGYSKIYFKTNEDLVSLYGMIDFFDKDVLSVLASSDQVFMARSCGAKAVDSFDKNPLAIYYYYLRCWLLQYKNSNYPEPILDNNYQWLRQLLDVVKVNNEDEKNALLFWKKHLKEKTKLDNLFFDDSTEGRIDFSGLKSIPQQMNFKVINMFQNNSFDSSYDVVVLSNIIEWARGSNDKIICVRDNLSRLLRQDGFVLCSDIIHRYPDKVNEERKIFDSSFEFISRGKAGYVYRKR